MEKNYDVIALGELLVDFTMNGQSSQGNGMFEACPGGAPCNVLALLNKMGKKTAGDKELRTPREATFQGSHTKTDREQIDILKIFKLLHERFWMIRTESS